MPQMIKVGDDILTKSEFSRQFGRDEKEAFIGLHDEGRPARVYNFAVGDTAASDIPDLLKVGIITELDAAYEPASKQSQLNAICTVLQSEQKVQDLGVLFGGNEDLRAWLGMRTSNRLSSSKVTATTETWERTYHVERKAVEDDKTGLVMRRIREIGNTVGGALLRRVVAKYIAMQTVTHWLDGQLVVDTDHSFGDSGTINNDSAGTTPTPVAITSAYQAMMGFLDYNGNDIADNVPNALLFSPTYWAATEEAFGAPQYMHSSQPTTGGDVGARGTGLNVMYQKIAPENRVYHPKLVSPTYGFLIRNTPIAPVIMVERSDVPDEWTIKVDPATSDDVFQLDRYSIGFRRRDTLVYGPFHHVYGFFSS